MAGLCREFGISRKTGYKILARYNEIGLEGLTDRSRRPYRHANQLPAQIETLIVRLKQDKPSWGAPKIQERETVKAYIVLRDDAKTATSAEDIIAWSRRHMAAYKVPRRAEFVEGLPTSSEKVLWRELQEREGGSLPLAAEASPPIAPSGGNKISI
jgi:acyl-CoA synthetase (AMP-forming)/AMP-acid ligase II